MLDFGLSKATRESPLDGGLTHVGQMLGTPDYIAPEQTINAQGADIRADIYSLGCTLYYLLSGGPPFHGTNLYDILQAHHSMEARPLNLVRPEVPVELAAVVDKMMAKDPARRFQTPGEVAEVLMPFFKKGGTGFKGAKPEVSRTGPSVARWETAGAASAPPRPAMNAAPPPLPAPAQSVTSPRPEPMWESLIENRESERSGDEGPALVRRRRPPWVWPSVAAGVLLLGLIVAGAAGVFRVRTPEGDIVFDGLPEHAVVTVDEKVCTVIWPGDRSPARVTVPSGEHRLKVELNGIEIHSEAVTIAVGDRRWIRVRLKAPEKGSPRDQPPPQLATAAKLPPTFTNSTGMPFALIPAGEFLMGTTQSQMDKLTKQFPNLKREWFEDEQPQHLVEITRPFYLAAYPVTVAQFRRFVESTGYKTEAEQGNKGSYTWNGKKRTLDPKANWKNPGFAQTDDHPVVCVSYHDAVAFLGWLNEQEKPSARSYRLPTEAEREYACRAGTWGLYGGSDDPENLVRIANGADASHKKEFPYATCIRGDDGFAFTAPVGSFEPNAWHLYDMIGNVWEWCSDRYELYPSSPSVAPPHPAGASFRVYRGGGWECPPGFCRPAVRIGNTPEAHNNLGFRVAAVQE